MFYSYNGSDIHVNCVTSPNSDVSGIGVRGALYLQAAMMIILSMLKQRPSDILFSNLSSQTTALALICATYFDPKVDVPHTLVASHFSILFSTCRISSYDILPSTLRSRTAYKISSRLWALDIVFRTILVLFNYHVWSTILAIQKDNPVCPEGFGEWAFWAIKLEVKDPSFATRFAYIYTIWDLVWEGFRYISGASRYGYHGKDSFNALKSQIRFDPRYWFLRRMRIILCQTSETQTSRSNTPSAGHIWMSRLQLVRKALFWLYIVVNIELTIRANNLIAENQWTFGQIFSIVNMIGLFGILMAHFTPATRSSSISQTIKRVFGRPAVLIFGSLIILYIPVTFLLVFVLARDPISVFYGALNPNYNGTGDKGAGIVIGYVVTVYVLWFASVSLLVVILFVFRWVVVRVTPPPCYWIIQACCQSIYRPFLYALLASNQGRDELAREIEAARRSIRSNPSQWWWHERLAKALERNGDLSMAAREWERITLLMPHEWWPQHQLAEVYESQEELDSAIEVSY